MGAVIDKTFRYAAFISYAHADEAIAARLHKALETYPVPRHLRKAGKTTRPVFRDVAELTAAHSLSDKIRDAVKGSRVLIVLCSPAAKASHWVNEEIRLFRELHGEASILSAIIDGTPETAFPAALTEGGREPLAAALGTDKSGFKLGVTQLAAGMLGTGLDDLIQRGARRRNRLMGTGLAASLALSGIMGFTAFQAVDARNAAETARGEAEGLVEYMIKDLKVKLEPVGRLDLLKGVGEKAVEYYDKQDIKKLPDVSLTRQAAARQVLAQVALDAGRMEEAQREIEAAAALTREVLERNPDDADAVFAHAQSEYWVGAYYFNRNEFDQALPFMERYNELAQSLYQKNPQNFDYIMEAAWGANNLGGLAVKNNEFEIAAKKLNEALQIFKEAEKIKPESPFLLNEIAQLYGRLSDSVKVVKTFEEALEIRDQQLEYFRNRADFKTNYAIQFQYLEAFYRRTRLAKLGPLSGKFFKDSEKIISHMEKLTQFDETNLKWRTILLRVYIDHYFYVEDSSLKIELADKITQSGLIISTQVSDKALLELFYVDLVRYDARLLGRKADITLEDLVDWQNIFMEESEELVLVHSELMIIFDKLGVSEKANVAAQNVIKKYTQTSSSLEPKAIIRLIKAGVITGQCENVSVNVNALMNRGYVVPDIEACLE